MARPVAVNRATGARVARSSSVPSPAHSRPVPTCRRQDGNTDRAARRTTPHHCCSPASPRGPVYSARALRDPGDAEPRAFVVAEPDGSGSCSRALAPGPIVRRFVRAAAWDPTARAVWDGSDSEGVLSDIVAGACSATAIHYDFVILYVAPPVYAMQQAPGVQYPTYPTCTTALHRVPTERVRAPALCDPFFSPCIGEDGSTTACGPTRQQPPRRPARSRSRCVDHRPRPVIPRDGGPGRGRDWVRRKSPTPENRPIEPRARAPLLVSKWTGESPDPGAAAPAGAIGVASARRAPGPDRRRS